MSSLKINGIPLARLEPVFDYLLNHVPPYIGLFILHADRDENIADWYGPWEKFFEKTPVVNQQLTDFAPFLFGMVPPLINPLVLSYVKVNDKAYAEIHIITDNLDSHWIIMVDQTRQIEITHPIIQQFYEEKLQSFKRDIKLRAKGALTALYLLDFISFEKTPEGYKAIGQLPDWFGDIDKTLVYKNKLVELFEAFPFIEVFEIEAAEIWQSNHDGKRTSGIWEEIDKQGNKLYLQALALRHDSRNYLLIRPLNNQNGLNNQFLQKAREQELTLHRLANTKQKLNELLNFKNQFISIVSHDLRSPLGAVLGLSEILLLDEDLLEKLNPAQLELLSDIRNEMLRMLDYNDKLYQWSNLELGNFKVNKKEVEARKLAAYIEKILSQKLIEKQITLYAEFGEGFSLQADETLLGQALNNLVGNSVKFTPVGGSIILQFSDNSAGKMITVKDTGIGMEKEVIEKLFTEFTRKSTMGTYGEKGTGLGLGIVKKIVDAHGFTVTVESTPGKGSSFVIHIPV